MQLQFVNNMKKNRAYQSINSILETRRQYEYKKDRVNSFHIDYYTLETRRRAKKEKIRNLAMKLELSESYLFRVFDGQCGMKTEKLRELCRLLDLEFTKIVKGKVVNYE